jgi:hypothetical protein
MAKSTTRSVKKKASPVNKAQIQAVADAAAQYVQHWAQEEAQDMIKSNIVILPTKQGYQVGKYAVKNIDKMWSVFNTFDELVDTFSCKQSAVVFCILNLKEKFNLAQELRRQDTRISKLAQDQTNYVFRRIKAVKQKDTLATDIIEARISETDSLLNLAREDLEKTLKQAKYLKGIWEQQL